MKWHSCIPLQVGELPEGGREGCEVIFLEEELLETGQAAHFAGKIRQVIFWQIMSQFSNLNRKTRRPRMKRTTEWHTKATMQVETLELLESAQRRRQRDELVLVQEEALKAAEGADVGRQGGQEIVCQMSARQASDCH